MHVSHFAFISITFSLFYHYSPIITHFYTSLSVICLIFRLILHFLRMLIMFNIAVILVVGPIFTLFLFHHFLNVYTLSYNNLSISYPLSVWSIFCFRLSAFLLSLQYFLIYLISFANENLSIFRKQHLVSSRKFKSVNLHHSVISIYPILHSFHVLFIFFFCIFITIFITQPLCTSNPPAFLAKTFLFPPIPHFSCCQTLDFLPSHFLIKLSSNTKPMISFPPRFSTRRFLFYLLLLCGDVETNPGP